MPHKFTLQQLLIQVNMLYSQAPPDISSFKDVLAPSDPEPKFPSLDDEHPLSFILDQINSKGDGKIDIQERASIVQYTSSVSIENK